MGTTATTTIGGRRLKVEHHGCLHLTVDGEYWGTCEFAGSIGTPLHPSQVDDAVENMTEEKLATLIQSDTDRNLLEECVRQAMPLPTEPFKDLPPAPVVALSNGVRVANFSSPHSFTFEDRSILARVPPGKNGGGSRCRCRPTTSRGRSACRLSATSSTPGRRSSMS